MKKSSLVRVKRKGQVTIPSELREELGLEEGSLLRAQREKKGILLQVVQPPSAGKVVGREEYNRVMAELDELRRNWRRRE
jgi:AbrB family looped-hinge helix DNA binding protein